MARFAQFLPFGRWWLEFLDLLRVFNEADLIEGFSEIGFRANN